ncbi:hypothetical protein [Alienimonas sp. DA493]|uniref:hypothetical protein n=1 Tax=Alienimonas sp. DA493 TaxID=3373605 RepID=UPI0037540CCF
MNDEGVVLLMITFVLAGFVLAGLWIVTFVWAAARRGVRGGSDRAAGAGRVMLGAGFGAAMGVVLGGGGALGLVEATGGRVDLPEEFALFLLALPVGAVVCPGLVLWGLVAAWRVAEKDPVDPRDVAAAAAGGGGKLDALDAPFDPPAADRGGRG